MNKPLVIDLHTRLQQNLQRMEALLDKLESNDDPKIVIAATAELRKNILAAGKTLETAMRAEAIHNFQVGVLEALAKAGVTVRKRILCLFETRAQHDESDQTMDN